MKDWTTLEQQIIELWKSRDLEVGDIKVQSKGFHSWEWVILAREKEE